MKPFNTVMLIGRLSSDPVERRMPDGAEVTELRVDCDESPSERTLPLPVSAWHADVDPAVLRSLRRGDVVVVAGRLVRRFYRSGAGARSLTEVMANALSLAEKGGEG